MSRILKIILALLTLIFAVGSNLQAG